MEINKVVCETPGQFRAECEKWAGKCVIRGRKLIAYGKEVAELVTPRGGYRQGAGRPRGDRTKVVTIRLSQEAVDKLNSLTNNKSEYIDTLIMAQ